MVWEKLEAVSDLAFNLVTDKFLSISPPPRVFYEGVLKRAVIRGNSGLDVVRQYGDARMNALDLALNCSAGRNACNDENSLVRQLVTAGAEPTGNAKAHQKGTTPHAWRKQPDTGGASSSRSGVEGWAATQFALRRKINTPGRVIVETGEAGYDSDDSPRADDVQT
jgi:hypothetical protein